MKWINRLRRASLLLCLLVSLLPAAGAFADAAGPRGPAQGASSPKRVLFINSYHPGYKWSDDIYKGIESVLGPAGDNADLRIEFMDTKRSTNEQYLLALRDTYRIKYATTPVDLVMVSDDAGLNFVLQYADVMFPNTPVVFCGANYFDLRRLADQKLVTGVSEEADLKGTLDIALRLHPQTTNVVAVIDTTVTGRQIHQGLAEIVPQYPNITFTWLEDVTMDEVRQQVSQLKPGSLVLVTNFFRDKTNAFFEFDVFSSLIAQSSAVPVYAGWDYSLGYGVVGGKLISGFTEGQRAAKVAQRVLLGEKPADIPVAKQVESRYMFDYQQLRRWGINVNRLPPGSVITNRPVSFYDQYRVQIWVAGIAFVVLAVIVVALLVNVLQRQRAQSELADSNRELLGIRLSLEQRVQERTTELARRAVELQAAAEVARATTSVLDPDTLLRQVVDLVRDRFDLYYVGLFLVDEAREYAVLHAGTGEAGEQMLARHHRLLMGGGSMIGQCVQAGQPQIALDVGAEAVRFDNPLLPYTRSELALPLRSRGQVFGAMTVQSSQPAAFDEAVIATMQTMADQVAVAIDNARLYSEAQAALREMQSTQERYLAQSWAAYARRRTTSGYRQIGNALVPLGAQVLPEVGWAARQGLPVTGDGGGQTESPALLSVPIVLRGRPIGALGVRRGDAEVSAEDVELAQDISEQFALAAENLRLFEEAQRSAARERVTRQIADNIRAAVSVDDAVQRAVQELGRALDAQVVARVGTEQQLLSGGQGDHHE